VAAFVAGLVVAAKDIELCDCFLEYGEATAEMLLLLTFVALGMSLIWLGLTIFDWRTALFAVIALIARPIVLYPVLGGVNLSDRDRRLVAAFGPRGLSSLLLALLPVFAGIAGGERLFMLTSLVVLLSVVVHGGGTAVFLRRAARAAIPDQRPAGEPATPAPEVLVPLSRAAAGAEPVNDRITIDEMLALKEKREPVIVVDARKGRNYDNDPLIALGAVRVRPDDPVRDATEQRLSKHATLVVYCA
jgi:hypothetical protein